MDSYFRVFNIFYNEELVRRNERSWFMQTLAALVAIIIICLIVVTPSVVLGNWISKKRDESRDSYKK